MPEITFTPAAATVAALIFPVIMLSIGIDRTRRIKAARFGLANELTDKLTVIICAVGFLACVYAAQEDGLEGWGAFGVWGGLAVAVGFWTDHLMRIITLDARSGSPRDADTKPAVPESGSTP